MLTDSAFLGDLDNDPRIGGLIDATSAFEIEQEEMQRKSGIDLTPDMWLVSVSCHFAARIAKWQVKLLMGPIDSSYDTKGESLICEGERGAGKGDETGANIIGRGQQRAERSPIWADDRGRR